MISTVLSRFFLLIFAKLEYHKRQNASKHLSVLCVVHCKVCWHPSCQHSQYDGLYVHQGVGSRIWNLLKGCDRFEYIRISLKSRGGQISHQCHLTHVIKRFGPGSDLSRAIQASQKSVAEYTDGHRQGVNRGAVECNAVTEALLSERRESLGELHFI